MLKENVKSDYINEVGNWIYNLCPWNYMLHLTFPACVEDRNYMKQRVTNFNQRIRKRYEKNAAVCFVISVKSSGDNPHLHELIYLKNKADINSDAMIQMWTDEFSSTGERKKIYFMGANVIQKIDSDAVRLKKAEYVAKNAYYNKQNLYLPTTRTIRNAIR